MRVTALKAHTRNKSQVRVYLDGQFAFSLTKIQAVRLRVGQELDEAALERLRAADAAEAAYERALRFLAVRPRSEAEVRRRLQKDEPGEAVVEAVLERLKRAGLVDDQAFADYWVENRAAFRPRSRRALRAELQRKGVDRQTLDQALEQADDAGLAYQLALSRAARLRDVTYEEFRRKIGDYLGRRGFDYETAAAAVERAWHETRSGAEAG